MPATTDADAVAATAAAAAANAAAAAAAAGEGSWRSNKLKKMMSESKHLSTYLSIYPFKRGRFALPAKRLAREEVTATCTYFSCSLLVWRQTHEEGRSGGYF